MSSQVVMPSDRTTKQLARGYCRNPKCRAKEDDQDFTFDIEHAHVTCPKCGANKPPMIGVFVLTHLLIPMEDGPMSGAGGLRYALACDEKRAYLATVTNLEAASGDIQVVNCPQCITNAERLGIHKSKLWTPDKT